MDVTEQTRYLIRWGRALLDSPNTHLSFSLLFCVNCNVQKRKLALRLRWTPWNVGKKELKRFLEKHSINPLIVEIDNLKAKFHEYNRYVECYVSPDLTHEGEIWRVC